MILTVTELLFHFTIWSVVYQKKARCQVQKVITYNSKFTEQQCVTFSIRYIKSTFQLLTSAPFSDGVLVWF